MSRQLRSHVPEARASRCSVHLPQLEAVGEVLVEPIILSTILSTSGGGGGGGGRDKAFLTAPSAAHLL